MHLLLLKTKKQLRGSRKQNEKKQNYLKQKHLRGIRKQALRLVSNSGYRDWLIIVTQTVTRNLANNLNL